jgi:hypothetical protein
MIQPYSAADVPWPVQVFNSNPKLNGFFNVLSTNVDRNGVEFVSTVEGSV